MAVKIAIIGKPNVGKSTLFNYFCRKKIALVADQPGLTRDSKSNYASLFDLNFEIIDTAGFENKNEKLSKLINKQIEHAVLEADIIFFVTEAKSGITAYDIDFARIINKKNKDVICLVNKCEGNYLANFAKGDLYKLGFKHNCFVSAEHNLGFNELYEILTKEFKQHDFFAEHEASEKAVKIAIIGRPNVGKSTFLNNIVGDDRVIVADQAGVTRDATKIRYKHKNRDIEFIDTAGIRKKAQIKDKIEQLSVNESFRNIRLAEVVIYLIDAMELKFIKQDLNLIKYIFNEGRVVLIALNKWDLMRKSDQLTLQELQKEISLELDVVSDYPLIKITALNKKDILKCLDQALIDYEKWNRRIPTAQLNNVLQEIVMNHQPKLHKGKQVRIKYITQAKSRPPTFYLNCNFSNGLTDDYLRYIRKNLAEYFDLDNIPVRIKILKNRNPYDSSAK